MKSDELIKLATNGMKVADNQTELNDIQKEKRRKLLYPVSIVPLNELTELQTNMQVVIDESCDRVINVHGNTYRLLPMSNILSELENTLFKDFKVTPHYKTLQDTFHVRYVIENENTHKTINNNDIIKPTIELFHSYNGKQSFSLRFGIYRLICSNGLVIGLKDTISTYKHKNTNSVGEFFKNSLKGYNKFLDSFEKQKKVYELLSEKEIKIDTYSLQKNIDKITKNTLFPTKAKNIKNGNGEILDTIIRESKELNTKPNAWLLYNSLNYELNHNKNYTMLPEKIQNIDKAIVNNTLKLFTNKAERELLTLN